MENGFLTSPKERAPSYRDDVVAIYSDSLARDFVIFSLKSASSNREILLRKYLSIEF